MGNPAEVSTAILIFNSFVFYVICVRRDWNRLILLTCDSLCCILMFRFCQICHRNLFNSALVILMYDELNALKPGIDLLNAYV